jgi:NADPH2:quinone reductase
MTADLERLAAAVLMAEPGPVSVLEVGRIRVAAPGPDEVLIHQTVIGLNFLDVYYRRGDLPMPRTPFINGFEGVGVVERVGSAVDGFKPGDRVGYALVAGAYADLRLLPADRAILLPQDVSDVNAAASLLKGMTAEYLLHRAHAVTANDIVLVHAAAGGLGSFLCQWAKRKGATVIGTVGSPDKFANARMNGCDHVFSYAKQGWVEEVRGVTADLGPTVIYDGVGRTTFLGSLSVARERGLCFAFGSASGVPEPFDIRLLNKKSVTLANPGVQHYIATRDDLVLSSDRVFSALRDRTIRVGDPHQLALSEIPKGHQLLESRASRGSIVAVTKP